jgi:Uma2 family endonuclease
MRHLMSVLAPTRPPLPDVAPAGEQRLVLEAVSWDQYEAIGEVFRDRPSLRLTYDRGRLEFMTTSPEHERNKRWLGRLVETMAEEFGKPIAPCGSPTFKQEILDRGFEPDECFWIAHELHMRGKLTWDPEQDPPPDLILEIEVSRTAVDRMGIFAAFRVPEVWRYNGETIRVFLLGTDGKYAESATSPTFPGVPLKELVRFVQPNPSQDYLSVVRSFRTWLQEHLAK